MKHLFWLPLLLLALCWPRVRALPPVVYINSPDTVIVVNFTLTPLTTDTNEIDRLACAADAVCVGENGQDRGTFIGRRIWNFLFTNLPTWLPYDDVVEVGIMNVIHGRNLSDVNAFLKLRERVYRSADNPSCPIGYSSFWDDDGQRQCRVQSDLVLNTQLFNEIISALAIVVAIAVCIELAVLGFLIYYSIKKYYLDRP